jgi:hypothetical protein
MKYTYILCGLLTGVLLGVDFSVMAQTGGFAELKVINEKKTPIAGATVQLVQDDRIVFESTTGPAGVVQWTQQKVATGRYIVRLSKGGSRIAMAIQVQYNDVGWVYYAVRFIE